MKNYKGKLGKIYNNVIIQDYISGIYVFGYLNHEHRSNETDLILRRISQSNSVIDENSMAEWICSKDARHFMDSCETTEYFNINIPDALLNFQKYLEKHQI